MAISSEQMIFTEGETPGDYLLRILAATDNEPNYVRSLSAIEANIIHQRPTNGFVSVTLFPAWLLSGLSNATTKRR
jgi:hypothetical protein